MEWFLAGWMGVVNRGFIRWGWFYYCNTELILQYREDEMGSRLYEPDGSKKGIKRTAAMSTFPFLVWARWSAFFLFFGPKLN